MLTSLLRTGVKLGSRYNPQINYKWRTQSVATDGLRYITDSGKSPRYDLALHSGQGAYFNGVDQRVDISDIAYSVGAAGTSMFYSINSVGGVAHPRINLWTDDNYVKWYDGDGFKQVIFSSPNTSVCFVFGATLLSVYVDGVLDVTEATNGYSQTLGNGSIASRGVGSYVDGVVGNLTLINTALTPSQIAYQYNNPEKFLYKDGVLKSDILSQLEIDNVVAWYPMCETDGYVRDMVNYSEGTDSIVNGSFDADINSWIGWSSSVISWDSGRLKHIADTGSTIGGFANENIPIVSGDSVVISLYTESTSSASIYMYNGSAYEYLDSVLPNVNTKLTKVIKILSNYPSTVFRVLGITDTDTTFFDNISVKKLTGTYPINNYTDACRTSAKALPYGLQTNLIDTDVLGVPTGKGDYLSLKGIEKPALPIDLTDDVLWGGGTGFVIEFVIERELLLGSTYLFYTSSTDSGIKLYSNRPSYDDYVILQLYGISTSNLIRAHIDNLPHHIIFEVTPTDMTMVVDGVVGTSKTHSFVPSGLNFKDNRKLAAKGNLHSFKIWFGDNYAKYDRTKSVEAGQKVIAKYEGWDDKGIVNYTGFNLIDDVSGNREIENVGGA